MDASYFSVPLDTPVCKLDAREAFNGLEKKEKLYAHYLSRAAWEGANICLLQTSPEAVPIFLLLKEVLSRQSVASLKKATQGEVSEDEFQV